MCEEVPLFFFSTGVKRGILGDSMGLLPNPINWHSRLTCVIFGRGVMSGGLTFLTAQVLCISNGQRQRGKKECNPQPTFSLGVLLYSLTSLSCWINAICIMGILPSNTVCPDILECATQIHNPNHPHVEQKTCGCTSWRNPPQQEYAVNDCRNQNKHKDPSLPENVGKPRFG